MHRPGLLLPVLVALACGPAAGYSARQSAPAAAQEPMLACVDAVLAGSPLVERVSSRPGSEHRRRRYLRLRNPPSPRSTSLGFAVEPAQGVPRALVVEYVWPGPWQGTNGMQPPPDPKASDIEGEMLSDIGAGLMRQVRGECAPTAPGEPSCTRVAQGRKERCVLGI